LGFAVATAGAYGGVVATSAANRETAVKDLPSYRDVVKRVLPAVVSVEAKSSVKATAGKRPQFAPSPFENMPGLPDELRKHFEQFRQQPMPEPPHGHAFGSGFVVDPSGVILTNEHVVRGAEEVEIKLQDGRKFTSRDIKHDGKTDLAVVRVDTKEPLPSLKLGDSDQMEVGDRVLAIGAPLGLTGSVTSGIVSAKGRDIHMNMYEDFIQTDAAINPGNSGGPLVNLAGEVVGINSAIKSGTGGFQGIGLAISSNLVKAVKDQLLNGGTVHRGFLGVQAGPLEPEVAARLGVTGKSGVVIAKVTAGSPAARCGLQDGDVLTEIAGQLVKDPRHLQQIVAGLPIGKKTDLAVFRDGARMVLSLTIEEQPESFGTASESSAPGHTALGKLGMSVSNLTAEKAKELGFADATEGVVVTDVEPDGVAGSAGLRSGVVILKADGNRVKSVAELQKALDAGSLEKGLMLQVKAPQGGTYVLLKVASSK
jgi:serine protease Do